MTEHTLKQLVEEVKSLRSEVKEIKIAVNEIDRFQHREVKPEYIKKLKRIASQRGKTYTSVNDLERNIGQ